MQAPTKVSIIDVERCPEAISRDPAYTTLWALVRERGRPRGMITLPFDGHDLSRDQLLREIAQLPALGNGAGLGSPPDTGLPSISVVIPSLMRRPETLAACLGSVAAVRYPDYEVIVVDNRPGAGPSPELAAARVVREPRVGNSAARNRGLAEAGGEIVAFTDDDVVVDPNWLLALGLRFRAHPEEAAVTGVLLPRELKTSAQIALEEYYGGLGPRTFEPVSHRLRVPPRGGGLLRPATVDALDDDGVIRRSFSLYAAGTFGTGPNMAFRRQTLLELGGFNEALGAGTPAGGGGDLIALARAVWRGYAVGYEPAAVVFHNHYPDEAALRRQIEGYGRGWGALLFALVLEDPRHLVRMLVTLPRAAWLLTPRYRRRLDRSRSEPLTRELARTELRAIAGGPAAYLRGRRRRDR